MLLTVLADFREATRVHLGDGSATSFWHDHWIGPRPLASLFPALHSHCRRPNITVASSWNTGAWDFHLFPRLSTTVVNELNLLTLALESVSPVPGVSDRRGISEMAPFSSAGAYKWRMAQLPPDPFATLIWDNAAPPRCKHFLWLLHRERLPSAALLHRRNIIDSDLCALCGVHEDQHHILLQCHQARAVWHLLQWPVVPHVRSFRDIWGIPELPTDDPRLLHRHHCRAMEHLEMAQCFPL